MPANSPAVAASTRSRKLVPRGSVPAHSTRSPAPRVTTANLTRRTLPRMTAVLEAPYPVSLELLAPPEVARWRPLVHWLLSIPYYVVLYVLQIALGVVTFVAWLVILFTGNIPGGMFDF